jgi:hypothetical protein
LIDKNLLPMVVMMLPKSSFVLSAPLFIKTSSGARPALPMVVAPEAIVEKSYFEYRLKDIVPTFILANRRYRRVRAQRSRW